MPKDKGKRATVGESSRGDRTKLRSRPRSERAEEPTSPIESPSKRVRTQQSAPIQALPPPIQPEELIPQVPPPPENIYDKFRVRKIVYEKKVDRECIRPFGIPQILEKVGWSNLLDFGGTVRNEQVIRFLSYCHSPVLHPASFVVTIGETSTTIDPGVVAQLLGIPASKRGLTDHDTDSMDVRIEMTKYFCNGQNVLWHQGNALRASNMEDKYKVLHSIFCSNVYPRDSNKSDITSYMLDILYSICHGIPLCLPTIIVHFIADCISSTRSTAIPFPHLLCLLSCHVGLMPITDRPILVKMFTQNNIKRMKLGTKGASTSVGRSEDIMGETEAEAAETDAAEIEAADTNYPTEEEQREVPRPSYGRTSRRMPYRDRGESIIRRMDEQHRRLTQLERLSEAIQKGIERVECKIDTLIATITCRRDDVAPPDGGPSS